MLFSYRIQLREKKEMIRLSSLFILTIFFLLFHFCFLFKLIFLFVLKDAEMNFNFKKILLVNADQDRKILYFLFLQIFLSMIIIPWQAWIAWVHLVGMMVWVCSWVRTWYPRNCRMGGLVMGCCR